MRGDWFDAASSIISFTRSGMPWPGMPSEWSKMKRPQSVASLFCGIVDLREPVLSVTFQLECCSHSGFWSCHISGPCFPREAKNVNIVGSTSASASMWFFLDPENHQSPDPHIFWLLPWLFQRPKSFEVWVPPDMAQNKLTAGPRKPIARNSGSFVKSWCGSLVPWRQRPAPCGAHVVFS